MTAFPRLLQSSKNPATRRLLEAGLHDRASERAVLGLTAALGLGVVAPLAAAESALHAAGHASARAASAAGGAALPTASGALPSALSIAKWLLLGACAGGATSAGYWVSQGPPAAVSTPTRDSALRAARHQPASARALRATSASRTASPVPSSERHALLPNTVATATLSAGERAREPKAAPGAELGSRAAAPVEGAAFPAPNAQLDNALERETRLVAGARQALSERDGARAAALLDNYDATKVLGVLDREALLLRVELSLTRGDQRGAHVLAERFERSYPTDAHIPRLRALLAGAAKNNDSPQ